MERGEGGGFTWGGVEGWGEKAYNCNCRTIKKIKIKKKLEKKKHYYFQRIEIVKIDIYMRNFSTDTISIVQ